jgi:hypothetical protein
MPSRTLTGCLGSLAAALTLGLASPSHAGPREDVLEAWQRALDRGAYSMVMSTESRGREYRSEMDVRLPSSFHMRSPDSEMVMLPEGTWMKVDGSWMQMPMNMSKMVEGYSKEAIEEGKRGLGEVEVIGEGIVEGCEAITYRYTSRGKFMGMKGESEAELSVCKDTGLPRLMTSTSGSKRHPDTVRIVYDFERDFEIRAPR